MGWWVGRCYLCVGLHHRLAVGSLGTILGCVVRRCFYCCVAAATAIVVAVVVVVVTVHHVPLLIGQELPRLQSLILITCSTSEHLRL